jgi:hypothetical protein
MSKRARLNAHHWVMLGMLGFTVLATPAWAQGPTAESTLTDGAATAAGIGEAALTSTAGSTTTPAAGATSGRVATAPRYRSTGPVITSGSGRTFVIGDSGGWTGRLSSGVR